LNLFVGGFIGSPAMNMLEAKIERSDGKLLAKAGSQEIELGDETLSARPGLKNYEGRDVILGIRPEDLEDAALEHDIPPNRCLTGTVQLREALGAEIMAHFTVDAKPARTEETEELARDTGATESGAEVNTPEGTTVMVGRFGARSRVREGNEAKVAVDTRALHFFDPETGLGIYDGNEKGAA
jgi:multiple sugar transport system ATP-binding protein